MPNNGLRGNLGKPRSKNLVGVETTAGSFESLAVGDKAGFHSDYQSTQEQPGVIMLPLSLPLRPRPWIRNRPPIRLRIRPQPRAPDVDTRA